MTLPNGTSPPAFPDPIPSIIDFGTVNILAGAPGVGKTTMYAEWCARFRDSRPICGHSTNPPTRLYYLSTDRGGHSTRKLLTLHDLLANDYTTYYNPLDDPTFDRRLMRNATIALDTLRWCLSRFVPAIEPGSQLAIDPAAPLFVPGSQNDPRSVAALLWELHVIAREFLVTIFVLAHFSKQLADASQRYLRPQDRISGSGAWSGFSDTQIYMVDPEPPAAPYYTLGWNPRHSAPADFKFKREGSVFVPYHSLEDVGTAKIKIPQSAFDLFKLIPADGCTTAALEQAARAELGISRATFFRDLTVLEDCQAVERPSHGRIRRVPLEQVELEPIDRTSLERRNLRLLKRGESES